MVDVAPLYKSVVMNLNMHKVEKEISLGIRSKNDKEKTQRHILAQKRKDERRRAREIELQHSIEDEQEKEKRRLEDIKQTALREKAWFMAHPHKFVRQRLDDRGRRLHPSDKRTFCIICKEKAHEFWVRTSQSAESNWTRAFNNSVQDRLGGLELEITEEVEKQLGESITLQAKALVRQALIDEGTIKVDDDAKLTDIISLASCVVNDDISSEDLNSVDVDRRRWEEEMMKMKNMFIKKGYCLLDAMGRRIFSRDPPKRKSNLNLAPVETPVVVVDDALANAIPHTISPHNHSESLNDLHEYNGLRIRVFHRTDDGARLRFLGMMELTAKV
jgi:citrate lyase gamma subunit